MNSATESTATDESMRAGRSNRVMLGFISLMILGGLAYALWPPDTPAATSSEAPPVATAPAPAPHVPDIAPAPEPEEGVSVRRTAWSDVTIDPMPSSMDKLVRAGEDLYKQSCLVCHGGQGKGDGPAAGVLAFPPRDFTRGYYKFKSSAQGQMPFDDDLYRTVTSGIPAAGMPSFADLTPFERWALVAYVKSISKFELPNGSWLNQFDRSPAATRLSVPAELPSSRIDLARGEDLYRNQAQCLKCHGDSGIGDGPSAPDLVDYRDQPIAPTNLTRGEVTFKAGSKPADIFRVLTIGMSGSPMPSFATLSEEDRWNLAYYVTNKLYKPIDAGERTYLRVGCTSCHTIGKGKLIGPDLAGVTDRRDEAWLKRWLKDPPGMLATDETARKLLEEYLAPMPSYGLTDREVDLLIRFLKTQKKPEVGSKE